MAKLKNSFSRKSAQKLPALTSQTVASPSGARGGTSKDLTARSTGVNTSGSVVQAINFGSLHTKAAGSASGSQWGGLLNAATSGGASSLFGGGILSTGTLGFIGKLLNLFGGGKSTPAAPTPFVLPASQAASLSVTSPSAANSIALGVQSALNSGTQAGPVYQQTGSSNPDHAAQTSQVVQIVKQALLTSSSLNDVISEI